MLNPSFQLTRISFQKSGRYIDVVGTYWAPGIDSFDKLLALGDNCAHAAELGRAVETAVYFTGQGRPVFDHASLDALEVNP